MDQKGTNMKRLAIYPEKCVGCKLCELSCSFRSFEAFNPSISFITNVDFHDEPFFFVSLTCFQCERPYCAEACPEGALSRSEKTGAVVLDKEKCTGCTICIPACPFGNILLLEGEGIVGKCELCNGDPECAKICPTRAIQYIDVGSAYLLKKRRFAEVLKNAYCREIGKSSFLLDPMI